MNKGARIFTAVVYYIFAFSLGILLALFLPFYFLYSSESLNNMQEALEAGRPVDAISLVGGYYNNQPVFEEQLEGGGAIVLFEAATLNVIQRELANGEKTEVTKMHKSYAGFLYGVDGLYNVSKLEDNKTILEVTDADGNNHDYKILNEDTNNDGVLDNISIVRSNGFVYLDLAQENINSIANLKFIDCDGNVFAEISLNEDNLTFDGQFFSDVDEFINEYNKEYQTDEEKAQQAERCTELDKQFLAKSSNYSKSSYGVVAKSAADRKAAVVVVCYFIGIYIIGDLLVGKRRIIKLFKWILVKVFKVKFREKQPVENVFGSDYYCQVTFLLDVSAVADFDGSVQVSYSDNNGEVVFLLMKEQGYTATQRVKAGTYVNMKIQVDNNYKVINLPMKLVAEGFRKEYKINLTRRED